MSILDTGLSKKKSTAEIVEAWERANAIMDAAYAELDRAKAILEDAFGHEAYMNVLPQYNDSLERMREQNKKRAWRQIINLLEIRKVMSIKRLEELDQNLENGQMPEITADNILAISAGLVESAPEYAFEAIAEVFEFLRPGASERNHYKTNAKNARFELGKKVIIAGALEVWSRSIYHVSHWKMDKIRAVDRVFHLIDGAGELKGYNGPLVDAIQTVNSSTGIGDGETNYFHFRCYQNGNLHLEFKRLDLVSKLNAAAGGSNQLRGR